MNFCNFENKQAGRKFPDDDFFFSADVPENKKTQESVEEDFNIFLEIADILAEQEYRKRRFLKIFKISVSVIFSVLTFGGIFIFAKKSRTGKCGDLQKYKI